MFLFILQLTTTPDVVRRFVMSRFAPFLPLILTFILSPACGGRPDDSEGDPVNNIVSGVVYMAGPVSGALVHAYRLDPKTGSPGDLLGVSEPTDPTGAFRIDVGPAAFEILV